MKYILCLMCLISLSGCQNAAPLRVTIRDADTKQLIKGADVIVYHPFFLAIRKPKSDRGSTDQFGQVELVVKNDYLSMAVRLPDEKDYGGLAYRWYYQHPKSGGDIPWTMLQPPFENNERNIEVMVVAVTDRN